MPNCKSDEFVYFNSCNVGFANDVAWQVTFIEGCRTQRFDELGAALVDNTSRISPVTISALRFGRGWITKPGHDLESGEKITPPLLSLLRLCSTSPFQPATALGSPQTVPRKK